MTKEKMTLEQENEILRKKVADFEANKQPIGGFDATSLNIEMAKIKAKGKSTAGEILAIEKHDHKNITLWTRDGQPIGPMHPDNAIRFLNDMAARGVRLSATRPTDAEAMEYRETPEYKKAQEVEEKRRALKNKSRKTGQVDKLIAAMERNYGIPRDQAQGILKPEEVKVKK